MQFQPKKYGWLILIVLSFILILLRFTEYFAFDTTKVIEPYGDGYKTYYAAQYHLKHDTSYSHFGGMNYPYGDHVIPGDCEPFLTNSAMFISKYLVDISDYGIQIVNFSMLLGILLCCLFLIPILL